MNLSRRFVAYLLTTALLSTQLAGCADKPAPAATPVPVFVTPVVLDSGKAQRSFTGTIRPRVEADLAFRAPGKVIARQVDLGAAVRAGQVLARLDEADYRLGLEAADADQARADVERFARLASDGSIGQAEVERQRARSEAARARLDQAIRQTALARNRLGYATLVAPFDGVVTAVRFETGQVVGEGQPIVTLARRGALEVVVDLPELLAPRVGQAAASAHAWGDDGAAAVPLTLRELAASASPQTRTYQARFSARDMPADWRIGATVELRLDLAIDLAADRSAPGAELPLSAVVKTQGEPFVWVADAASNALQRRPIVVQSQGTDRVRVLGLQPGWLVVSVGAHKLDEGMRVRPVARPLDPAIDAAAGGAEPRP
jgi:membrane fusion protein, multidrug efflux system